MRSRALCALLAGFALLAPGCALHRWRGPVSDHFDGRHFRQPEPFSIGFLDWLKHALTSRRGSWREFTDTPTGPPPPPRVSGNALRLTFVNHSTVLIQMDGVNILTDPNWSDRSVPDVGRRRRRPPGIRFEDLPPIDAVLISHDHHDHMDLKTLRRLAGERHPAVFTGLGNSGFLARHGVPGGRDLDWWQTAAIAPGVTLTAVPSRHMSGRSFFDRNRTLWCGFVIEGPSGTVYFAGDTGYGAHFAAIAQRFPKLRLALLPIGGFLPLYYMRTHHMGPEDALEALRVLHAGTMVPIHFGTFPAGDDDETEPVDLLRKALAGGAKHLAPRVVVLDNGQSLEVPSPGPPLT